VVVLYELAWVYVIVNPENGPIPDLPWIIAVFAAVEFVYRDARKINRQKGADLLNATLWSLLAFVFGPLVVPLDAFRVRSEAMSLKPVVPSIDGYCSHCGEPVQKDWAKYCSACGSPIDSGSVVRPQSTSVVAGAGLKYYDVVILGALGILESAGGILFLLNPPNIAVQQPQPPSSLPIDASQISTYLVFGVTVLGLAFVVAAVVIFIRRRAKYQKMKGTNPSLGAR
jgi:hypothetical protein